MRSLSLSGDLESAEQKRTLWQRQARNTALLPPSGARNILVLQTPGWHHLANWPLNFRFF